MKVLIADDEINIILLIKSLIDRQKTDVEIAGEAGDGITALEMVRQLKPDVVITDIRMPGMNGMDLIRHVRDVLAKLESQRASRERTADAVQPYGGQAGIQQWDTAEEPFAEPSDGGRGAVQAGPWDREG
ncbi:MAG: response regulator [Enterocloster sp.]